MAKKGSCSLQLVAAHLQFDQVMLAIECLHTGYTQLLLVDSTAIPALSIQSCNRHDLADVSKQLLKIAKTLRGTKQLEGFFFLTIQVLMVKLYL